MGLKWERILSSASDKGLEVFVEELEVENEFGNFKMSTNISQKEGITFCQL